MKGIGNLSGAVMQIAFILTAFHFQSLIFSTSTDLPLLCSLHSSFIPLLIFFIHCLLPLFHVVFFSISSPIYPHSFTQSAFHLLIPIASPLLCIPSSSFHLGLRGTVAPICKQWAKKGCGNTLEESVNGLDHYH